MEIKMNTPQNCPHPQFAVVDGRCTHCGKATPELKTELNKRYGRIAPLCIHESTHNHPERMPLRYGSAAIQVCDTCGDFRLKLAGENPWRAGPVQKAIADAKKAQDEVY
jgi:hypothetical protein